MPNLKPANANPWYVLMTLYGEQTGDEIDWELHRRNRAAWNAWAGQALDENEARKVAAKLEIDTNELRSWPILDSEIQRLHQEEMISRNPAGFRYPDLPIAGHPIDLRGTEFDCSVVWQGTVFGSIVSFTNCLFHREVDFTATVYCNAAAFDLCNFLGKLSFEGSTFFDSASFLDTKFAESSNFNESEFCVAVSYSGAQFAKAVQFDGAKFEDSAYFCSCKFSRDTEFIGAKFSGLSLFLESVFGNSNDPNSGEVYFNDCHFEKSTSFHGSVFRNQYPVFAGTVFHEKTEFTAKDEFWPARSKSYSPEASKETCATIRHILAKQGLPEEEHFFFRREMDLARRIYPFWQRLPYWFFGVTSRYGESIARPVYALLVLLGLGASAFAGFFASAAFQVLGHSISNPFVAGAGYSFANVFSFFGFGRRYFGVAFEQAMPWYVDIISATQVILGYVFLFFLGLGLRKRFRLR